MTRGPNRESKARADVPPITLAWVLGCLEHTGELSRKWAGEFKNKLHPPERVLINSPSELRPTQHSVDWIVGDIAIYQQSIELLRVGAK